MGQRESQRSAYFLAETDFRALVMSSRTGKLIYETTNTRTTTAVGLKQATLLYSAQPKIKMQCLFSCRDGFPCAGGEFTERGVDLRRRVRAGADHPGRERHRRQHPQHCRQRLPDRRGRGRRHRVSQFRMIPLHLC